MSDPLFIRLNAPVPKIEARGARVLERLAALTPVHTCSHLHTTTAMGLIGLVCAEHPAAGILCPDCCDAHIERHSYDVEHRCDECGETRGTMRSMFAVGDVHLTSMTTAGEIGVYIGMVSVLCVGVCLPCSDALGLPEVIA